MIVTKEATGGSEENYIRKVKCRRTVLLACVEVRVLESDGSLKLQVSKGAHSSIPQMDGTLCCSG